MACVHTNESFLIVDVVTISGLLLLLRRWLLLLLSLSATILLLHDSFHSKAHIIAALAFIHSSSVCCKQICVCANA